MKGKIAIEVDRSLFPQDGRWLYTTATKCKSLADCTASEPSKFVSSHHHQLIIIGKRQRTNDPLPMKETISPLARGGSPPPTLKFQLARSCTENRAFTASSITNHLIWHYRVVSFNGTTGVLGKMTMHL